MPCRYQSLDEYLAGTDPSPGRARRQRIGSPPCHALLRNAVGMHVDAGILVRVAALEDLIRIRRARRRTKDQEVADLLVAIEDVRSRPMTKP